MFFKCIDFEKLYEQKILQIIVSPSNSHLCFNGGIDLVYSKIFPGIEEKLVSKANNIKYEKCTIPYKNVKYIVPVGKTIICETNDSNCPFILAAPTMRLPRDINGTDNIYKCMFAILEKISEINNPMIIGCPCLGTGIGNVSAE